MNRQRHLTAKQVLVDKVERAAHPLTHTVHSRREVTCLIVILIQPRLFVHRTISDYFIMLTAGFYRFEDSFSSEHTRLHRSMRTFDFGWV